MICLEEESHMGVREIPAGEITNTVRRLCIEAGRFWDMMGLKQCLEVDDASKRVLRSLSLSRNTY
jgi:hypothetical protein